VSKSESILFRQQQKTKQEKGDECNVVMALSLLAATPGVTSLCKTNDGKTT